MKSSPLLALILLFAAVVCSFGQGEPPGTIKATIKQRGDGSRSTTIVDPDQRTAEETITDMSGKVTRKTTFVLDERNLALGAIHYDAKGNIHYKESFRRDSADHVIEASFTSADGRSLGKRIFTYQGDKVASVEDYDAQGIKIMPAAAATSQGRPDKHKR